VTVDSPGGNGLLLSRFVRGAIIRGCEFKWVGDSAIVLLGSTPTAHPCSGVGHYHDHDENRIIDD
jgi:hypothetical protein